MIGCEEAGIVETAWPSSFEVELFELPETLRNAPRPFHALLHDALKGLSDSPKALHVHTSPALLPILRPSVWTTEDP